MCSLPEILERAVAVDEEVKAASIEVDAGLRLLKSRIRVLLGQRERLKKSDRTLQKKIANLDKVVSSCEVPGGPPPAAVRQ